MSATKKELKITGTTKIQLRLSNGEWEEVTAVVILNLSDEFFLGWYSQIKLEILPSDWPHPNHKVHHTQMCPKKYHPQSHKNQWHLLSGSQQNGTQDLNQ